MIKNQAGQYLSFQMLSATDGSDVNSGTTNVQLMKDGGSYTGASNAPVFKVYGVWTVALTQAETNCDHLVAAMTISGAITAMVQVYPVNPADFKSDISALATAASIAALNDFDPSSDTVASVSLVATCTTNSDMRGTDNANTVAPDNAKITANGNAIAALNDFDPSSDTVAANVQSVATDAIDAAAIKADAVTEIQSGLATASELANVPKLNTQYAHTAQSGDTIRVTIS